MTKIIEINQENPNGVVRDMTEEEISQRKIDVSNFEAEKTAQENSEAQAKLDQDEKNNLKASAKTKLMNGETLTEEEANEILGL